MSNTNQIKTEDFRELCREAAERHVATIRHDFASYRTADGRRSRGRFCRTCHRVELFAGTACPGRPS